MNRLMEENSRLLFEVEKLNGELVEVQKSSEQFKE
jgi:hypothetical protein